MINYDLTRIRGIVFDVDGVLSCSTVSVGDDGIPLRTSNIKDGYALQLAVKMGLHVAIITGANVQSIHRRYAGFGIEDIYIGVAVKMAVYDEWLQHRGLEDSEVVYVGDDIPDLEIMRRVGCACCPKDACHEIRDVATYVSRCEGGRGVARDIIEQVLLAQKLWLADERAFGW